jgi:pimeloyl-ACP methyl ester carboxylesterase
MTDYLEVDGVRLEYRRVGPGNTDLPVIVLLHEGLGCVDMWRTFPQNLSDTTGHPVFVYSRQGYGRSDPKPAPWSLRYMHDEGLEVLPKVLAAAGLDDVILVGHSDGASIALIYAGGAGGHCACALILMAPHVFNEPVCVASIEQARDSFIEKDLRARLQRHHGDNVDHVFWGWNGAWLDLGFRGWNIEQYLPAVNLPVLLIQGNQDQYGTVAQIEAIERQVSGFAERALIDDCTHRLHKDQPDAVLAYIVQFLDRQEIEI